VIWCRPLGRYIRHTESPCLVEWLMVRVNPSIVSVSLPQTIWPWINHHARNSIARTNCSHRLFIVQSIEAIDVLSFDSVCIAIFIRSNCN